MSRTFLIPLHINPRDYSREACDKRYELHLRMMELNPKGWRQYTKCAHRRKQRQRPEKPNRLRMLAELAYGK